MFCYISGSPLPPSFHCLPLCPRLPPPSLLPNPLLPLEMWDHMLTDLIHNLINDTLGIESTSSYFVIPLQMYYTSSIVKKETIIAMPSLHLFKHTFLEKTMKQKPASHLSCVETGVTISSILN